MTGRLQRTRTVDGRTPRRLAVHQGLRQAGREVAGRRVPRVTRAAGAMRIIGGRDRTEREKGAIWRRPLRSRIGPGPHAFTAAAGREVHGDAARNGQGRAIRVPFRQRTAERAEDHHGSDGRADATGHIGACLSEPERVAQIVAPDRMGAADSSRHPRTVGQGHLERTAREERAAGKVSAAAEGAPSCTAYSRCLPEVPGSPGSDPVPARRSAPPAAASRKNRRGDRGPTGREAGSSR